jgi:hypothetical protein
MISICAVIKFHPKDRLKNCQGGSLFAKIPIHKKKTAKKLYQFVYL